MATSPRSERWVRIEYLFYAALELEPDSRAAFLEQACRDDADLLKEVESLLKVEGQTIGFLRKPGRHRTDCCGSDCRQAYRRLQGTAAVGRRRHGQGLSGRARR